MKRVFSLLFAIVLLTIIAVIPATAQDTECEAGFRAVTDSVGSELCLPEQPERIISLTDGDTDSLVALGIEPVGVSNGRGSSTPPRYLLDFLVEDYISVGGFFQPNLEIVLELEPDLILFSYGDFADPELVEQLNGIAPVFIPVSGDGTWQDMFTAVGQAVNMEAEVDAFFAEYETSIEEISATIEEGTQFLIARWAAEGPQVMAPYIFAPAILQELGLVMPDEIPELDEGHAHSAPLSLEAVQILDADWLFAGTLQAEGDAAEALDAIFDNPLFQQLEVVQNEQVVIVDGSIWTSSGGPLAANLVLDVVAEALGGTMEAMTCDDGMRAVTDAVGTQLCVPENPERIISLTDGDTDSLVALGIEAVGVSNGRGSATPPRYLLDFLPEGYVSVGGFFQPNLEIVLELEPDLILFSYGDFADSALVEQLNEIAPVFITAGGNDTWQDLFIGVGEATNMGAEVDSFFAEFETRKSEIVPTIEEGTQFLIARWAAEGPQVMAPYIFAPAILQELGLVMPDEIPELDEGHAHSAPLSLETLQILDADWLFAGTLQAEGDAAEALDAIFDNPLFQQLEVVQNEQVVIIDGSIWTSSGGPLAANIVLDVVEATFGGSE